MAKKELMPISNLFRESWDIFKKIWQKYLIVYLISTVTLTVFALLIISPFIYQLISSGNMENVSQEFLINQFKNLWPYLFLALIVLIGFASAIGLAIYKFVFSAIDGKDEELKASIAYGFKNFLPYLGINIVIGLLILLGLVLLVIPGIYLGVIFSFVAPIFIVEGIHSLSEMIKRSRELVTENFWNVFGRLLLIILISAVISGMIENAGFLVNYVVNFVTTLFSLIYSYLIYKELAK